MTYYFEQGYPINSVLEYLLNLINSGFEEWRAKNPTLDWREFKFGINDITMVAPVFDTTKVNGDDVTAAYLEEGTVIITPAVIKKED